MTTSLSKLFVGGLSWGTIDSVLFEEFAKYGPLDVRTPFVISTF